MSLTQANNQFAVKLYSILAKEEQNVLFSPVGISSCLTMLLCAAKDETFSELQSVLGIEDVSLALTYGKELLVETSDDFTLDVANIIYHRKGFAVKQEYKSLISEPFNVFFIAEDAEESLTAINDFVRKKTSNNIPQYLKEIPATSAMSFFNIIYFKGQWMTKFEKTSPGSFFNSGLDKVPVEMMHLTENFDYYENQTLQVLQLPFFVDHTALMIFLPREKFGLQSIESALSPTFVTDFKKKLSRHMVQISLPRFELEVSKSLVSCFQDLGMKKTFTTGAQFPLASESPELMVSDILHTSILKINEDGCEAVAVTGICVTDGVTNSTEFCADHPFLFAIYNTKSDMILFIGRVNKL